LKQRKLGDAGLEIVAHYHLHDPAKEVERGHEQVCLVHLAVIASISSSGRRPSRRTACRQQIRITGQDHRRAATHGQFEKLVVSRIAASRDPLVDPNTLSPSRAAKAGAARQALAPEASVPASSGVDAETDCPQVCTPKIRHACAQIVYARPRLVEARRASHASGRKRNDAGPTPRPQMRAILRSRLQTQAVEPLPLKGRPCEIAGRIALDAQARRDTPPIAEVAGARQIDRMPHRIVTAIAHKAPRPHKKMATNRPGRVLT
jgi:hypothetical protein